MDWSYYGSHCKYCNEATLCNDYNTDNEGNHLNCKEKSNAENHAIEAYFETKLKHTKNTSEV